MKHLYSSQVRILKMKAELIAFGLKDLLRNVEQWKEHDLREQAVFSSDLDFIYYAISHH